MYIWTGEGKYSKMYLKYQTIWFSNIPQCNSIFFKNLFSMRWGFLLVRYFISFHLCTEYRVIDSQFNWKVYVLSPFIYFTMHHFSAQIYVRAFFDYDPSQDTLLPCQEVGLPFRRGDILCVVERDDMEWWQVRSWGQRATAWGGQRAIAKSNLRSVLGVICRHGKNKFWSQYKLTFCGVI